MRIKILVLGNNPTSLISDCQLLRDRGMLVFTAFNLSNINELVSEIKPDIVFFDAHQQDKQITDTYNEFVNGIAFTHIPVIYTLSEDDVYLITRKRTAPKEKRTIIADNIINAIKMAVSNGHTYQKKTQNYKHIGDTEMQLSFFPTRA
jgi:hypothetical protein